LDSLWGAVDFSPEAGAARWIRPLAAASPNPCFVSAEGDCALRGPSYEPQSAVSSWRNGADFPFAIAGDIQLHNREDLMRALGWNAQAREQRSDAELVLAAYEKWREECAGRLLGEFSFAIWDKRRKRLYCCRDQIGFRAFLYWQKGSRFIFSSNLGPILECPGVDRALNRRKLAGHGVPTGQHFYHRDTYHAGIYSLPAGAWMTVDRSGTTERQYWEPKVGQGTIPPRNPAGAIEQLREILFQAVECRLDPNRPVSVFLSGGLDSSSIASIAARCLEKRNRELTAISAVLPSEAGQTISDEREFIEEFRAWPNVRINYVRAEGRGPFDSLGDPRRFEILPNISNTTYLIEECERTALASGSLVALTGVGGELGATAWSERYYLELAISLQWLTLWKELRSLRALRGSSRLRTLVRPVADIFRPWRRTPAYGLLAAGFLRECEAEGQASPSPWVSNHAEWTLKYWLSKHALRGQSAMSRMGRSLPMLDKRVLEFCLSLPTSLRVKNGYQRYPIRAALSGILPERIRWRTDKNPFSPDYGVRYNVQLPLAKEFVAAIRPNDPVRSIVDVEAIKRRLVPLDPMNLKSGAIGRLPAALYLIAFLRQFPEFRL
jgi:asparagine synthase (glutamine-hydrolysing)